MEIERKFLPLSLPENLEQYPHKEFEQAYLCTGPVLRVRREGEAYVLTYKGGGAMIRQEENLPLNQTAYEHLKAKADGNIITKTRYFIPIADELTAELDLFHGRFEGMQLVEVEFPNEASALTFEKPDWFGEDVTFRKEYHNSYLSQLP